jgi:acyl phosphate:glycerol-3-phosphate acyltransferase
MITGTALLALLFGYLCGSIPFGLILTRLGGTQDIRTIGSKSIGATNVLRTGRKDLALATVLLDALKGTFAVWVAWRWGYHAAVLAGLGAFLGHVFPVWLNFRGGKGVATYIGVLLAFNWKLVLLFGVVWLSVAAWKRYSSLASLSATSTIALLEVGFGLSSGRWTLGMTAVLLMSALLFWKHRENIERLRAGTEGKIGQKG